MQLYLRVLVIIRTKCPNSEVAGQANTFIFPDITQVTSDIRSHRDLVTLMHTDRSFLVLMHRSTTCPVDAMQKKFILWQSFTAALVED